MESFKNCIIYLFFSFSSLIAQDNQLFYDWSSQEIKKANTALNEDYLTLEEKNILTINDLPLVSIDFNHNSSSSIFDITQTQVINNKFCRVLSWYDNEWGFSNRMIETLRNFKKLL